jgi:DNA-binding transcriptional LysR family regulator
MRVALKVVEQRGLRRAAAELGISEAAASQRLRSLEEALTVSLFQRSRTGLVPTQAGVLFLQRARDALAVLDKAVTEAAVASRGLSGSLTVGLSSSLSTGPLRQAVQEFRTSHAEVEVKFLEAARSRLIEGLRSRTIDLIVLIGPGEDHFAETLHLWREQVHVVLPVHHDLSQRKDLGGQDLKREEFVFSSRGTGPIAPQILSHVSADHRFGEERGHYIARDTIMTMVEMGFGLSLLLESDLGMLPRTLVARPLVGDERLTRVPLTAYRDPMNDNPPLRRFWSLLKHRYAERPEEPLTQSAI